MVHDSHSWPMATSHRTTLRIARMHTGARVPYRRFSLLSVLDYWTAVSVVPSRLRMLCLPLSDNVSRSLRASRSLASHPFCHCLSGSPPTLTVKICIQIFKYHARSFRFVSFTVDIYIILTILVAHHVKYKSSMQFRPHTRQHVVFQLKRSCVYFRIQMK